MRFFLRSCYKVERSELILTAWLLNTYEQVIFAQEKWLHKRVTQCVVFNATFAVVGIIESKIFSRSLLPKLYMRSGTNFRDYFLADYNSLASRACCLKIKICSLASSCSRWKFCQPGALETWRYNCRGRRIWNSFQLMIFGSKNYFSLQGKQKENFDFNW